MSTLAQYEAVTDQCARIFLKKTVDYGTAWRVLRTISIVDQIFIKAFRIRNLQELKEQKITDDILGEFIGIINYAVIGLMQLQLTENEAEELDSEKIKILYSQQVQMAAKLMMEKNHDYGEAWRQLSQESFVDLILMKLQRMRQIIANKGVTLISEGLDANYFDILNYGVFALILLQGNKE